MSWIRLDDKFPRHPKVAPLTDREFRIHIEVVCWCAEYQTDGRVNKGTFRAVTGLTERAAKRFLALGIWDEDDAGRSVHNWRIFNADTIEERIAAYLESHPEASANEVARKVGGKRAVVLAIHAALAGSPVVPPPVPDQYPPGTPEVLLGGSQSGTHARASQSQSPVSSSQSAAVANGVGLLTDLELTAELQEIGWKPKQIAGAFERDRYLVSRWVVASRAPEVRNRGAFVNNGITQGVLPDTDPPAEAKVYTACKNWIQSPAFDPETMDLDHVLDEIGQKERKLGGKLSVSQRDELTHLADERIEQAATKGAA